MSRYKTADAALPEGYWDPEIPCTVLYHRIDDYDTINSVGGDGISADSRIGHMVSLRQYQADLRACLAVRCQQQGGVQFVDPMAAVGAGLPTKDEVGDTGGVTQEPRYKVHVPADVNGNGNGEEAQPGPWLWAAVAAAALLLL
jgi:hypothetical protein